MNITNVIIKHIRVASGLSAEEVADGVGIDLERYLSIERDPAYLTFRIFGKIKRFWNISSMDFFTFHLTPKQRRALLSPGDTSIALLERLEIGESVMASQQFALELAVLHCQWQSYYDDDLYKN